MIICFVDGLKVLFIGTSGSGKSSVINILRGTNECKTGLTFTAKGITRERKGYASALQESKLGKPVFFFQLPLPFIYINIRYKLSKQIHKLPNSSQYFIQTIIN